MTDAPLTDRANYQILESSEADFGEMTWTFRLGENNRVGCGSFAIIRRDEFNKILSNLGHAEGLLRQMLDGDQSDLKWRERVMRYFDPKP